MFVAVRWLRPTFYDLEDAYGRYHSYQVDAIKGIETVKAVGGEPMFRQLMLAQFQRVAHKLFRADFLVMGYDGAVDAVTFLGLGLFLWAGAHQVLDGQLTIGGLVAFNSLLTLATVPISNLLLLWDILQRATVLLNRLDDVFEQEPEQGHDRSRLRPVRSLTGHITFRHVGFRYGGPEAPPILQDITLDVPAGKTVAIVGRSGSGKTTLAKCLSGLLEPTDGADPLRRIGPQDAQLSRSSAADRIRPAGRLRVCRHHRPQHRIRRRRTRHGARRVGGADGERRRFHRASSVRLRHAHRRNRPCAIRRAATAGRHRPCAVRQAAGARVRRSDQLARYRVGAVGAAEHGRADARTHHVHHRAPSQHRAARRPDHRARARPPRRAGDARRVDADSRACTTTSRVSSWGSHDDEQLRPSHRPFLQESPPPWAARALPTILIALFVVGLVALFVVRVPETVQASFVLAPVRDADPVRALHPGIVSRVNVVEAQVVSQGEVLFVLASESVGDRMSERRMIDARLAGGNRSTSQRTPQVREPTARRRAGAPASRRAADGASSGKPKSNSAS